MPDLQRQPRQYYYRLERQKFACIAYAVTGFFLALTILQWYFFYTVSDTNDFFTEKPWLGIIGFSLSIMLILIFIFFENLRFFVPVNWIFAIFIFESAVLGLTSLVVRHYKYQFMASFFIWTGVLVLFIILGTFIPHDLTLDIVVLVVFGIISFITAIYFLMLYMVANVPYTFFVCRGFIVFSVLLFVMYHAQIINGGRFAEIRDNDYLLAALILYYDFLFIYLFSFQLAPKWFDKCDAHYNKSTFLIIDHHVKSFEDMDSTNVEPILNSSGIKLF